MWSISTQWQVLQEGTQGRNRPSGLECPALAETRRFGGFCALWRSQRGCENRVKWLREETDIDGELMDEKNCFYYVDIEELNDRFYRGLLNSIDAFVLESSEVAFQRFRREAQRVVLQSRHVTGCKIRFSRDRSEFLDEIQDKYALWYSNLEYRPLREVIMGCEDEGLMKELLEYENLLRARGETILYNFKKEQQRNGGLCLKLKAKHETMLATLVRMQEFLVKDVGLDDAIFTGFREGCIEVVFKLSSESSSISMDHLLSSASLSKLLRLGVSRVELSGHWVIDTASGRVTYMKSSQKGFWEDSESEQSGDESTYRKGCAELNAHKSSIKQAPVPEVKQLSEDEVLLSVAPPKLVHSGPVKMSQVTDYSPSAEENDSGVSAGKERVWGARCSLKENSASHDRRRTLQSSARKTGHLTFKMSILVACLMLASFAATFLYFKGDGITQHRRSSHPVSIRAVGVGRTLQCPYSSACFEYFHKKFPQARGLFPNDLQHNFSRNVTLLQPFNICSFGNGSTSTATSGSINMCRSFWIHTEDWHHLQLKRLRKKNERGVNRRVRFFVPVEWETWADEACDVFTAPQAHRVWFPAQQKMAGPVTMEEWKFEQLIGSSQGGVLGLLYSASAFKVMSNMFSYNESVDLCCIPKMASGECISPVSHFALYLQDSSDMLLRLFNEGVSVCLPFCQTSTHRDLQRSHQAVSYFLALVHRQCTA